ncbi:MAG: TolB-like protein/Tfp pilus assembly protein PilF [Pseudohongiellaceae bacterium]|jgi:TolB-like protein/Tfp pilus assembly protein PilF
MRFKFNNYILDSKRFELSKDGVAVHAEPQIVALLLLLIENSERMVGKEEINQTVWNGRAVSEAALSSRIKTLRQLLGDDGKAQKVIKTVHSKGFRFVSDVSLLVERESTSRQAANEPVANAGEGSINRLAAKPTIAVLPFANLSDSSEQEYFSDGVTADIINRLSKHKWLNIVARNTSFGFKGKNIDARTLGNELAADYLVEGAVQKAGGRVRVSAMLINASNGHQIWAERYDREIDDIFAVQDEITEKVTAQVEPEIGNAERKKIVLARPDNLQSWDCYHLGIYYFYQFTSEGNQKAQELLKKSQQLDKNFGEAYVWWAYAVVLGMVYWNTKPTKELLDEALLACDTALALDSQNASFYSLRARVLLARKEYKRAIAENRKAIDLNPTLASAYCGLGDSLAYEGRYEESVIYFEKAVSLSPNDPQLWAFYSYGALMMIFSRDYERALDWCERATLIPNCQYWAYAHQAVALAYLDRPEEARQSLKKVTEQAVDFSLSYAREKMFYLKNQDQINLYLDGLKQAGVVS